MSRVNKYLLLIIALFFYSHSYGRTVMNGSFEVATTPEGCNYNLSNGVFNGYRSDVIAFGDGDETDIIMGGCCVTDLIDGLSSIFIAHVPEDEVSMIIDIPLTLRETYTISFWAMGETTFSGRGDIQIGTSSSATNFGTLIQTVTPTEMACGNHTFTFVAPNDATHITVKMLRMVHFGII